MKFRHDINGLRAIAVIAVLLFHFNPSWMPGGFAGVDVFFVISGYLMTGIIVTGIQKNNFSIFKFYLSRANRIVPPLATLCLCLLVWGWFYLTPFDYKTLSQHILSSVSFISNIVYWRESGYFVASVHEKWLLHTWSLSTEWQFYMLYPLVLVWLNKIISLNKLKAFVLIATIVGLLLSIYATVKWPNPAYYLLPTRAWEMLFGGLAFLYPFRLKSQQPIIVEVLGITLILFAYVLISQDNAWPGYLALAPVLGTFLVIQANRGNSLLTNNVIFQKLGQWSYSIYLWHWPFVVVIYYYSLSALYVYIGMFLSVLLGFLSYRYIESFRFRNDLIGLKAYATSKPILLVFVAIIPSCLVYWSQGANVTLRHEANTGQAHYLSRYHRNHYKQLLPSAYSLQCDQFDDNAKLAKSVNLPASCTNNGKGGIFLWGDSHMQALSYGIRKAFPDEVIHQVTASSCRPLVKQDIKTSGQLKLACDMSNQQARNAILQTKPNVILIAQRLEHDQNQFEEILHFLHANQLHSKLVLVGPVPQWEPSLPSAIAKRHYETSAKRFKDNSQVKEVFFLSDYLHKKYDASEIAYISITDILCNKNGCLAKVDNNNTPLVWDYGHLTLEGSEYVVNSVIKNMLVKYLN